ncbi:MAG: carbamoyl-phosphate synthase large subunit [Bdellovibrionaceae bacterium]|nr:carbamoyl-phosphate synthase large subunit [Pseudobdellovibrionaceae bacterium]
MGLIKGLDKIMIIGSGPIVIGQACEFDYSGVQACKALMQLGLEVVLVNSNPATIMTDHGTATKIYIEPLELNYVKKILEKERPSALISTLGGQTALNLSVELEEAGVLSELGVKLLGADLKVIQCVEDRERFVKLLNKLGVSYAPNSMVRSFKQGLKEVEKIGFPVILRPNYTLGGSGGGIAYSKEDFKIKLASALTESPSKEVLIEKSLLGWKEFELEIMRDKKGTCVVVCSIENIDPCGVHTGDSMTVAPQITLSNQAYQEMRESALKIIEEVGLETGGANIQFAVHPQTGERMVIEVNPRVSRSSALASKATGFPIAKISALLAVGFTLDEIKNDITGKTLSCYEPALDYIVTKIPRFDFEKYPGSEDILSTQMQSVGEVMAIGRTFKESFQKALAGLEKQESDVGFSFDEKKLTYPNSQRIFYIFEAFRRGYTVDVISDLTDINSWFLEQFEEIVKMESKIMKSSNPWSPNLIHQAKRFGFSDKKLSILVNKTERDIYKFRKKAGIIPSFYKVDTCAGEFESQTPYYYSTYWREGARERNKSSKKTILLIGSGPNRIGQGIEFDYSCVRGVKELKKQGYEVVLINSNPETVSTDYDTADQLFFEPVSLEYVREVLNFINPFCVIVQLGGQTPIELASQLHKESYKIAGSSAKTIDLAEDRGRFAQLCSKLGFKTPRSALAENFEKALKVSQTVGFPLMARPSYVLGGRRMEIIQNKKELKYYFTRYSQFFSKNRPCLIDQYLESFLEVDVDLVKGVDWAVVGGILEHIEATGVHSGDSMAVFPPQRLKKEVREKIEQLSLALAEQLKVKGFLNLQLAIREDEIYMLEANPRSSRSVPFISKATGLPLVDLSIKAMMGYKKKHIKERLKSWDSVNKVSVKGVVFPFKKIKNTDSILGPEMKSIGEVMGRGEDYPTALTKALISSDFCFPERGEIFLSLRDKDKMFLLSHIQDLVKAGYVLSGTQGTFEFLKKHDVPCERVKKVLQGRPHCVDRIISGQVALVFNTTSKNSSIQSSFSIRRSCIDHNIPCLTEAHAIQAFIVALIEKKKKKLTVTAL